jgi:hypothetical protein
LCQNLKLHLQWFDHVLKEITKTVLEQFFANYSIVCNKIKKYRC